MEPVRSSQEKAAIVKKWIDPEERVTVELRCGTIGGFLPLHARSWPTPETKAIDADHPRQPACGRVLMTNASSA